VVGSPRQSTFTVNRTNFESGTLARNTMSDALFRFRLPHGLFANYDLRMTRSDVRTPPTYASRRLRRLPAVRPARAL
jgi:hypothetical protein